jgi:hypothetical protein
MKINKLIADYSIKTIEEMKAYLLREGFYQTTIDKMSDEEIQQNFNTMLMLDHWD